MPFQIIFIRHGAAENRGPGQDDFDRHLTKKGRKRLEDTFPVLRPLLKPGWEIEVWTSPLVRAMETAEIAADIFRADRVAVHDFIGEGYFNGFWTELEKLDPASGRIIIVVGHTPHMDEWSRVLCGSFLPFGKGAAAGFLYEKGGPETSGLEWFFQPEGMEALAGIPGESDLLKDIQIVLQRMLDRVFKKRDNFLAAPDDPETAHQLRVSIRKLRSVLSFIRPFQKEEQNSFLRSRLREIVAEISYLRELDVLRESCEVMGRDIPGRFPPDSAVFGLIGSERDEEARRVVEFISSGECGDSLRKVRKELKKVDWKAGICADEMTAAGIFGHYADMYKEFEKAAADLDYGDAAAVHALRIEAKKLRYVLGAFGQITGSRFAIVETELKEAHTRLGELCDARINREILTRFSAGAIPEAARRELGEAIAFQDAVIGKMKQ